MVHPHIQKTNKKTAHPTSKTHTEPNNRKRTETPQLQTPTTQIHQNRKKTAFTTPARSKQTRPKTASKNT